MRYLKRYSVILVFILFVACVKEKSQKKITIGFLADTFKIERWQKDRKYFVQKVEELGGQVIVKSAEGNDVLQLKLAQELIDEGVQVIVVVAVNTNSAASIVRLAHKHNVKVIAYARLIRNSDLDYFVTFDVLKIGELQAEYIKNIKPSGNYVLINGDRADINAQIEHTGVMNVLRQDVDAGNINILYDGYVEGWSPVDAQYLMRKVIEFSNEPIDAVIVGNDGMATGVFKTLAAYGLNGKVLLTGLDAELIALKRILKGDQTMTVYMSIKELAFVNAELAIQVAKKEKIKADFTFVNNNRKDVPTIILNPQVVDKSNIETTVIAEQYVTKEEIENSIY